MLEIKQLGLVDYQTTFTAMQDFTRQRQPETVDQLWLCQHQAVFTQGLAGKAEHLLNPGDIPLVATNRGGQVTYHGPGQLVAYPLIDLRRKAFFIKEYVRRLEQALLDTLEHFSVEAQRVAGAPGVYVRRALAATAQVESFSGLAKIAALGVKVHNSCTYHGVALNVAMDLEPFSRINPCGYAGLSVIDLAQLGVATDCEQVAAVLVRQLQKQLMD